MRGLVDLDDKLCPPLQAAVDSLTKEFALPGLANLCSKKVHGGIALKPPRLEGAFHKILSGIIGSWTICCDASPIEFGGFTRSVRFTAIRATA